MDLIFLRDEETARKWQSKDPQLMETFNLTQALELGAAFFVPLMEDE
jgi:hypothetical protein